MTTKRPLAVDLAAWVAAVRPADLPAAVVADCRRRILDTLGLMLAAAPLSIGRAARSAAHDLGSSDAAAIVGTGETNTAPVAALVNGTMAHAMDFDDTHNASVMHPSAVTVATALAMAQSFHLHGRELVLGVAIGNEIACRLGLVAPGAFHDAGLHPTSVLGTPAAALLAGRMMGLTEAQLVSAVGISASQGSGVLEAYSDGTWSKTMHPGWAAHAGITAALLARAGFTGPATGLDGRYGLFPTHLQAKGQKFDFPAVLEGLGSRWHMLDTAFKLYPCAHSIHAFVEGALLLRARENLDPASIKSVWLDIPDAFIGQIAEPRAAKLAPRTTTHARASVFYAVAAALLDGELTMDHYEDAAITRPDIRALCAKIKHRARKTPADGIRFSGGVTITRADGAEMSIAVEEADGTGSRPLTPKRVEEKFRLVTSRSLPPKAIQETLVLARRIETISRIDRLLNPSRPRAA